MQHVIFCTTISVFCEIYTLRMRVVAHAAILWVGWFFFFFFFLCRRPELGLYLSPALVPEPGRFESSGRFSGVGWASFGALWSCVSTVWTSSPVEWLGGLVVVAGPRGRALAAVVSPLVKGRTWTSLSYWFCVADWQPHFSCFGDSGDLAACVIVSTRRWGLCAYCCWCHQRVSGEVPVWILGDLVITSLIFMSEVCDELSVFYAVVQSWACCICLHHVLCNKVNER